MPVQATIQVVNDIPFDDLSAAFKADTDYSLFTDYVVNNRFEKDRQIWMLPSASPTAFQSKSVSFVQLASPTLLWIADWTACKLRSQPEAPDPTPKDPNWILLDDWYEPSNVTTAADGTTPLYRLSGTYVYGHVGPSSNTLNNICFGRPPWLDDIFDRTMPSTKLQQNIINITGGTTSPTAPPNPPPTGPTFIPNPPTQLPPTGPTNAP